MNQVEIRTFIETYFGAFQSEIVENNEGYYSVKLPIEVDKDLGNRPFYWMYAEKIGLEPNTLTLSFIFDRDKTPPDIRGEEIPFGSRRLHQIFDSAKRHGKFVRLYEEPAQRSSGKLISSSPLVPWLGVNYKIEFICDRKREILFSLGINLISGTIVESFYQLTQSLVVTPKLPDYTFTMQPIFGIDSATKRLEEYIQARIDQEDKQWAAHAWERLREEKNLVESYYNEESIRQSSTNEDHEESERKVSQLIQEKETRLKELQWQHEPRVQVGVLNLGLFYLCSPAK